MEKDSLYIEKFLDIKKYTTNDPDFDLKTTFDEENLSDAKQIFEKYNLFSESNKNKSIGPIKEPRLFKKLRKLENEKSLNDWGDMKKMDITPELENDLKMLQLRNYLNPKSFYKGNDLKKIPNYFQVGTILEGGDDFVSGRLTKKEKRNSLIEHFIKDDTDIQFSKRKFLEIQKEKMKRSRKNISKFNRLKNMGKRLKRK